MSRLNKILLVVLTILAILTAVAWFFPDIFSTMTAFNPFGRREITTSAENNSVIQKSRTAISPNNKTVTDNIDNNNQKEAIEEELSPFEKEIMQRYESYQTKVFTYKPYNIPVSRNPFQRIVSSVYLEEEEKILSEELKTKEDIRRFVQPELPPNSKFSGLISAGEERLAILQIDKETYIVKQGDLILDRFLIKAIWEDTIIIGINGHEIPLQLGGGETTDE